MHSASFDSKKTNLIDLLKDVDAGKLQLPDFQRGWVWDDERIRSLLASISVSFPIGAIMTLATGGESSFLPRAVEGVRSPAKSVPEILLLDGQQRLTSLYQALYSPEAVKTQDVRGKVIRRKYYIDMRLALDEGTDRDEWIVSVPEDGIVRTLHDVALDVSSPELEYNQHLFPANQVFDEVDWLLGYLDAGGDRALFTEFKNNVIERFQGYALPVIELGKESPKEAVCLVFEKVNTGGVTLTVFELMTAMFAADNFQLREDWRVRKARMAQASNLLAGVTSDQFLQVVTLLATLERRRLRESENPNEDALPVVGTRRRDILQLHLHEYQRWADEAENGFVAAAKFLVGEHVFAAGDIPYQTQVVPLAAVIADLGPKPLPATARDMLARWYWCGVFGEMYAGSVETIFARDLMEVTEWIRGAATEPSTITAANFQANRLLTLRTRNSAAYKGVHARLMRLGSADFQTGVELSVETFFDDAIDIHHIFPQSWCEKQSPSIPREKFNSIINKTALSAYTNRHVIRGDAPSEYLARLQRGVGANVGVSSDVLDTALRSHAIPIRQLRADDFWGFFALRAEELLQLIEEATGKSVTRDLAAFTSGAPVEEYDDYGAAAGS